MIWVCTSHSHTPMPTGLFFLLSCIFGVLDPLYALVFPHHVRAHTSVLLCLGARAPWGCEFGVSVPDLLAA